MTDEEVTKWPPTPPEKTPDRDRIRHFKDVSDGQIRADYMEAWHYLAKAGYHAQGWDLLKAIKDYMNCRSNIQAGLEDGLKRFGATDRQVTWLQAGRVDEAMEDGPHLDENPYMDARKQAVGEYKPAERHDAFTALSNEVEQLEQKLARAKELEASAKAVTRRLQDDVMGRVRRLEANIRGSGKHRPVEEALMTAISEEVAKDWASIEDEAVKSFEKLDDLCTPALACETDSEGHLATVVSNLRVAMTKASERLSVIASQPNVINGDVYDIVGLLRRAVDSDGFEVDVESEGNVPVVEAPKSLVGNVTDVDRVIQELQDAKQGVSGMDKLVQLFRSVVEERDAALCWENHFRSQLRHVETDLKMVMSSAGTAHTRVLGAIEDAKGLGTGNYVNIPPRDDMKRLIGAFVSHEGKRTPVEVASKSTQLALRLTHIVSAGIDHGTIEWDGWKKEPDPPPQPDRENVVSLACPECEAVTRVECKDGVTNFHWSCHSCGQIHWHRES